MNKVLLIDSHPVMRKGLALTLNAEPDLEVCCQTASAEEALALLETAEPDLVMLDLALPGMEGLAFIEQVHERRPALPLLVFTENKACALRAIRAGARGYIAQEEAGGEIVFAVRRVLEGHYYVSEEICDRLLFELAAGPTRYPPDVLSRREMEVFTFVGQGLNTGEIARRMKVSPKTVDSFRRRIKSKLGLTGIAELIQRAVRWVDRQAGGG